VWRAGARRTIAGMTKRPLILAASLAAALLLPAGAAHAETFCVSTPGCANHDLQDALEAAADDPGADRVELGEGTFTREGGFRYFADNATNPVEIVGQGKKTVVRALPSAFDARLTSLALYGPGSTVRDLRVAVPGTGNTAESAALWLDRNTVEDVTVTLDPDAYGAAIWSTASTLRRVDAEGTWAAVITVGSTIEDSRLTGIAGVDVADSEDPTAILRSRIEAKTTGVSSGGSVVAVRDSLIRLSQVGIGLRAYNNAGGSAATVDATHVTLAGPGAGTGAKAVGTTGGAIVTFVNGVMTGFKTPAEREKASPATGSTGVVLSHSVLPMGASGLNVVEDDVLRVDELQFADAAHGDYTLAAGSPALDRGMDAPPGGLPPADLLGRPRKADGDGDGAAHPDPGAFERPAPVSGGGSGTGGGTGGETDGGTGGGTGGGDTTAPAITDLAVKRRPRRVRFALGEPARVTITVARRRGGRWLRVKVVTREAPAGAARVRLGVLRPGRYRVGVHAVDAAGNVAAPVGERFRVR
jgi:hypothetical protein